MQEDQQQTTPSGESEANQAEQAEDYIPKFSELTPEQRGAFRARQEAVTTYTPKRHRMAMFYSGKPEEDEEYAREAEEDAQRKEALKAALQSTAKEHKPRFKSFGKVGAVIVAVVLIVFLYFNAGAGMLILNTYSTSGTADGYDITVSLYEGDVSAELTDDDESNDPEPVDVNQTTVGQSTTFNVSSLGKHTVAVTYTDESITRTIPNPIVVNMSGFFDQRESIDVG